MEAAVRAGALFNGPARDRAVVLWSAVHGALMLGKLARLEPGLFAPGRQADKAVRALLQGWGAGPKLLARAAAVLQGLVAH